VTARLLSCSSHPICSCAAIWMVARDAMDQQPEAAHVVGVR